MKTDTLFYEIFRRWPDLAPDLAQAQVLALRALTASC